MDNRRLINKTKKEESVMTQPKTENKTVTPSPMATKIHKGKMKASHYAECVAVNEVWVKEYGVELHNLEAVEIDRGTIVEQFLMKATAEEDKLKSGEKELADLINTRGTQFPMVLNGQKVTIRINGAVDKS